MPVADIATGVLGTAFLVVRSLACVPVTPQVTVPAIPHAVRATYRVAIVAHNLFRWRSQLLSAVPWDPELPHLSVVARPEAALILHISLAHGDVLVEVLRTEILTLAERITHPALLCIIVIFVAFIAVTAPLAPLYRARHNRDEVERAAILAESVPDGPSNRELLQAGCLVLIEACGSALDVGRDLEIQSEVCFSSRGDPRLRHS